MRIGFLLRRGRVRDLASLHSGQVPDTSLRGFNHIAEVWPEARARLVNSPLEERLFFKLREFGYKSLSDRMFWYGLHLPRMIGMDVIVNHFALGMIRASEKLPGLRSIKWLFFNEYLQTKIARGELDSKRLATLSQLCLVLCLSNSQVRFLEDERLLSPGQKALFYPMTVDERFFDPGQASSRSKWGRRYILAVGNDPGRDYGTLLEAVKGLDVQVIVRAEPKVIGGLAIPKNVRVLSEPLAPADYRDLMAGALFSVMPLHAVNRYIGTDGPGLTAVLESMSMGKIQVVTQHRWTEDYLEPGRTALVVPPGEPEALRFRICALLADEAARLAGGRLAREAIQKRFTTRHAALRLRDLLRRGTDDPSD